MEVDLASAPPDEFSLKLLKLLENEGKSLDNLQPLLACDKAP